MTYMDFRFSKTPATEHSRSVPSIQGGTVIG